MNHLVKKNGHMRNKLALFIIFLFAQNAPAQLAPAATETNRFVPDLKHSQEGTLIFPGLLEREALEAGNPLATYAAMLELEPQYRRSEIFARIYPEVRFNFEEFLGFPFAGLQAMQLPQFRLRVSSGASSREVSSLESYRPEAALRVIEREARKTQIVIWAEEHHLPQTRSLYEPLLRALWRQGYRYLAAEAFTERVMRPDFHYPDYHSGYYVRDPIFASAVRTARRLGYELIEYDTTERGPSGDSSFRDRTQAANIKARVFDRDPQARVLILAGRGHASEEVAPDGWTPMASVLKRLTGINPLTLYAPTMSQRLTRAEEHPLYRLAISRRLVEQPTIFAHKDDGKLLGSDSLDAYVFWPTVRVRDGRPDWMVRTMGRRRVPIPRQLSSGSGLRLVQAFAEGEPASAIPVDQVVLDDHSSPKVLMLPTGRFWLRTVDRHSRIIGQAHLTLR